MPQGHWMGGWIIGLGLGAMLLLSGCAGDSRRSPAGESASTEADWKPVAVTGVDLQRAGGKQVLSVKVRVPSPGWKVEIRPLPTKDESTPEFSVVGLPPAGSRVDSADGNGKEEEQMTATKELGLSAGVEKIWVHGSQGADVIDVR